MNYKLSPTSLNLMKECPRCFWLTQHKIWKRPSGPFSSLPNGLDKLLKNYFNKYIDNNKIAQELKEYPHLRFFDFVGNTISYKDKKNNILNGRIDMFLKDINKNKIVVLDFKTRGFPIKEDTIDYYKQQLNIYNYILNKKEYKIEDYSLLLFYIPREIKENGVILFNTELIKVKNDIKSIEIIWNNAITLLNNNCPEKTCIWCKNQITIK